MQSKSENRTVKEKQRVNAMKEYQLKAKV